MIRRYPNHVDTADENGYVDNCPHQVNVTEFGHSINKYICGCRYDEWPVSLVKQPRIFTSKVGVFFPVTNEQLADTRSFTDAYTNPDIITPDRLTWRERWSCRWIAFREWLGEKVTPDNWDNDYDSWGEW